MQAYSTALTPGICRTWHCAKPATHEVFDRWNTSRGIYCATHARRLVAVLTDKTPDIENAYDLQGEKPRERT